MTDRAAAGRRAESVARRWLERHGLRTVRRNFRCRHGELDLVMRDGDTLVVVEVRSRASGGFVAAALSVDGRKQQRIIRATEIFRQEYPRYAGDAVRFDVVALTGTGRPSVEWIRDAFSAD